MSLIDVRPASLSWSFKDQSISFSLSISNSSIYFHLIAYSVSPLQVSLITHGLHAEEDVFDKEDLDDILILINYRAEESDLARNTPTVRFKT